MTKEELKKLEDNLWDSANTLRATTVNYQNLMAENCLL